MAVSNIRHDWTLAEIERIYRTPFSDLIYQAQTIHRENFSPNELQRSSLLSVKTGGCSEDCKYCPQSAHHDTGLERHKLLDKSTVLENAKEAKAHGSTRFCMGAAWREVRDGADFDSVLELVQAVSSLGLEVCCTMGMLTLEQAKRLKASGCDYYNHNLDTSPEYYENIVTTRTYEDRLNTISSVRKAGISLCCGGIIGMGESEGDRLGLLRELANQDPHPESVPINCLVRVEGVPLEAAEPVHPLDFVRVIATARIIMPKSLIRLSAGRTEMSDETQSLCFIAGANSIFAGEKLLTTKNPGEDADYKLMQRLGMHFREA
ncbi:MAG: biotin synthase BioB [Deltaproteobacteria bacterium]|nr:biotin synthase BioB [Deltaproteobacteria bacterium]